MPDAPFEYAVVRVVPWVERGELINVGVIVFCRTRRFLAAGIELDQPRLLALAPGIDCDDIAQHLALIPQICAAERAASPISALPQFERFQWLVAPRSTVIQTSVVHGGICADPQRTLDQLMTTLVRLPR